MRVCKRRAHHAAGGLPGKHVLEVDHEVIVVRERLSFLGFRVWVLGFGL